MNRQNVQTPRISSEDPDFGLKVSTIFNIIRLVHHLENVSREEAPVAIRRMTNSLTTAIRPALPGPNTHSLIDGAARHWEFTTLLHLREHYTDTLKVEINKLTSMTNAEWRGAFEVAFTKARGHLGKRLNRDTVERAEAHIVAGFPPAQTGQEPSIQPAVQPMPTVQPVPTAQPVPIETQPGNIPPRTVITTVEIHPQPGPSQPMLVTPAPSQPTPPSVIIPHTPEVLIIEPKQTTSVTVGTMTESGGDWSPVPEVRVEEIVYPTPPPPPKARREFKRARMDMGIGVQTPPGQGTATRGDDILQPPQTPRAPSPRPQNPCAQTGDDSIQVLTQEDLDGAQNPQVRPPPAPPSQIELEKAITSSVQTRLHLKKLTQTNLDTTTSSNEQEEMPTRRPTRHLNTTRKMQDWSLSVGKKFLIMGDSNVARFPPFKYTDLQVDSYPGATFRHAEAILAKTLRSTQVEAVVLSFGINNRAQKAKETTFKQLQRALKEARDIFPQARIYVPEINYSQSLPLPEQNNLQQLNKYIKDNYRYIPALSPRQFETERDGTHWTHPTALKLLQHWATYLNC